jgi:hypothetical protein
MIWCIVNQSLHTRRNKLEAAPGSHWFLGSMSSITLASQRHSNDHVAMEFRNAWWLQSIAELCFPWDYTLFAFIMLMEQGFGAESHLSVKSNQSGITELLRRRWYLHEAICGHCLQ